MLEYLRLKNVGPAPEMEMELAPRLNLITGDNGLGKSFLLDAAWWALTRKWPNEVNRKMTSGYMARPTEMRTPAEIELRLTSKTKSISYTSTYSPRDEAWIGAAGRPWNPGLVIYAHADGAFSVWDPTRNYWKRKGNADVQERLPAFVFSPNEVWDGLTVTIDGRPTVACNGLIADWAGWIKERGRRAHAMASALKQLSPSSDPNDEIQPASLTRVSVNDSRDIPTIMTPYAVEVPIIYASSGVRRITALAYMLLWSWIEHTLAAKLLGEERTTQVIVLVDEIEAHLHPRWQRAILRSVLGLAGEMHPRATLQVIAATHSPLILASAEPVFDSETDAWFDLDLNRESSRVELRRRDFVRHGDVSHWLTSDAFDLKSARSLEGEVAIEKARTLLREPAPSPQQAQEVDAELRRAGLPDIDPFWVRWGKFLEDIGATQ